MTDENVTPVEVDYTDDADIPINVFDDSEPEPEVLQEIAEPEPEEEPEGEEQAEPPAAEEAESEGASVPLTALKDERQKRQSAEEELVGLKKELSRFTQKAGDVPDPEADPIGYQEFMKDEAKVKVVNDRISMSAQIMSETKDDYAEMESIFLNMGNKDPKLFESMNASKNPALFAYRTARDAHDKIEAAKVTANEELKASIRADLMKEFKITAEPSTTEKRKTSALSMPNLTNATAKGDNSTPIISSKHDSEELFNGSPF